MAEITLDPRGPAGANGLNWYTEARNPLPADGRDNESWLNTRTLTVFKKVAGTWMSVASIAPSPPKPGTPGAAGNTIYSDEGPPSSQLGRSGDFYLQKSSGVGLAIYGPKAGSTWPPGVGLVTLIVGGTPPVSSTGVDGQSYIDTVNGVLYPPKVNGAWPAGTYLRGLIVGSGPPPASVGVDGTTYIDTTAFAFYGPKAGGAWPAAAPLQAVITGSGAPASGLGLSGQIYVDTAGLTLYGPKTSSGWGSGASLVGKAPFKPIAAWVTNTDYTAALPASFVSYQGASYACLVNHTSGTFSNDLAAGYWGLVAGRGQDGTGTGTVKHTGTPVAGNLPRFSDTTGDLLEDSGVSAASLSDDAFIDAFIFGS